MNFTDPRFFVFAAITFVIYYLPPLRRLQIGILVAASAIFYAFDVPYLLILLVISVAIATSTSYLILRSPSVSERRFWATLGVIANLGILAFFKYKGLFWSTFFGGQVEAHTAGGFVMALPLPIGISFYTFHGMSLLIDVYKRGNVTVGGGGGT